MFEVKREQVSSGSTIFQRDYETAQGGFTLDTTGLTAGAKVPEGSIVGYDEATRKAKPLVVAEVYENAADDAVAIKVKKSHLLVVGMYLGAVVGGKACAITAIDTTNAAYDVVTIETTLGVALTAGDAVFQSSATGAAACALNVTPRGLLYQDTLVEVNSSCAVAVRATVYERRIPVVPTAVKTLLPNIIFSKSY